MSESRPVLRSLPLDRLLLDPNNPRLIDDPLWSPVDEADIVDPEIQEQTTFRLQGDAGDLLALVESIKQFGWLEVEPVRVRLHETGRFVIIDGNRRIVALRAARGIAHPHQPQMSPPAAPDIQVAVEDDFAAPAVRLAHGLRHTENREEWSSFNAALWRRQLHQQRGEGPVSALPRDSRHTTFAREELALELCIRYRRSPWGDDFRPDLFVLFMRVLSHPDIRKWLGIPAEGGDDSPNLERFFSWISTDAGMGATADSERDDDLNAPAPRRKRGRALIRSATDVRKLASLLPDPRALKQLDIDRDLDAATLFQATTPPRFAPPQIEALRRSLQLWQRAEGDTLPQDLIDAAQSAFVSLRRILSTAGEQPVAPASEAPWPIAAGQSAPHLRSLQIHRYRGLAAVSLQNFGQVNLLVGVNNAGKTSVLESIYLLARQSDPRGLLDTLNARVRADPESRPEWLVRLLPREIHLAGTLGGGSTVEARHAVSETPANTDSNLAAFLATLRIDSCIGSSAHTSTTEFYANRPRRTQAPAGSQRWLAPATLHSPFSLSDRAMLVASYERSIEDGTKPEIVEFIRAHVDDGVEDIELANTDGRFMVQHRERGPLDLSCYGEGMQRIFEVSMLFAAHARGILLIDEFENALHTSVLIDFSRMVQQLALRFDVQVFLSTHSKETIDAFILNDFQTDDVVAFVLRQADGGLQVDRFPGSSLRKAIEAVDVDIRRL